MAFSALKAALTSAPVLHLPDFTATFIVDYDALGSGFGAVLHQDGAPIAFFSRPFAARHLKVAAYERKLIGLMQEVALEALSVGAGVCCPDRSLCPQVYAGPAAIYDSSTSLD